MKKNLFIVLSFLSVLLVGCSNQVDQAKQIDPEKRLSENGVSIEETFNNQIKDFQYIKDFEDFVSYNILSITEDKPFTSNFSLAAKFDKKSSIQGGIDFLRKKTSKAHDLEISDITFNIQTKDKENKLDPFDLSGTLSLLYEDNEAYAKLHDLGIFMGEGNMAGKMYSLLGDLIIDSRVNLEVHSGGIITINEQENKELPHIIGTFENILKAEDIESNPNFLGSIVDIINTINSYINLGISTDELKIVNHEISYFELDDKSIQKAFSGSFQGSQSSFELLLVSSKKGLGIVLHNIKEYDESTSEFKNTDLEFSFTLKENKNSKYSIDFTSYKSEKKSVNLQGEIDYADTVDFFADFVFEQAEVLSGQKISGKLNGNVTKKSGSGDEIIPELTGKILSLSELLSSL